MKWNLLFFLTSQEIISKYGAGSILEGRAKAQMAGFIYYGVS